MEEILSLIRQDFFVYYKSVVVIYNSTQHVKLICTDLFLGFPLLE